jgi:hypothetical protein
MYGAAEIQKMMTPPPQPQPTTPPFYGKVESDYELYRQLLERFQFRNDVHDIMDGYNSSAYTVVGLHIRAGNGEQGDFEKYRLLGRRGREGGGRNGNDNGGDLDGWIANVTKLLYNYVTSDTKRLVKPPLIFLATDTPEVIDKVQEAFASFRNTTASSTTSHTAIPIVVIPQHHPAPGEGVSYEGHGHADVSSCLDSWKSQFMDMMVLSEYSNIVVAGQYSSFTQTIPLSMIFHHKDHKKYEAGHPRAQRSPTSSTSSLPRMFCEVGVDGNAMQCFDTFVSWITQKSTLPLISGNANVNGAAQMELEFDAGSQIMFPIELTLDSLQKRMKGTGLVMNE